MLKENDVQVGSNDSFDLSKSEILLNSCTNAESSTRRGPGRGLFTIFKNLNLNIWLTKDKNIFLKENV